MYHKQKMRRTWRKAKPKQEKRFKANTMIRTDEVFLIDESGEKIGVIPTRKAREMAEDVGLDLIEVNPTAEPPVVKIMDYGQFKYEREKQSHKQKKQQKKVETKGIRLSVRISKHDFDFRIAQAIKFFQKGHKLKLELILKGREKAHPEKAAETFNSFVEELEKNEDVEITREQDLTKQGGKFTMVLVNKAKSV